MRRKLLLPLIGICAVAAGLLATNLALGYKPALGLDLRGGISVTLRPVPGQTFADESLDLAVEKIRERVDSVGVGEPEILRQGDAIVVNLPGVNDQNTALNLVKVTGKVFLRPVLGCQAIAPTDAAVTDTSTADTGTADTGAVDTGSASTAGSTVGSESVADSSTATTGQPGPSRDRLAAATATTGNADTTVPPASGAPDTTAATSDSTTASTDTPTDASTTTVAESTESSIAPLPISDPTQSATLPNRDNTEICAVGPSGGSGDQVFESDSAEGRILNGDWGVTVDLKDGSGGDIWNTIANQCFTRDQNLCPSGRMAIELDGVIQSAPTVSDNNFQGNVQITGDFSKGEAQDLAQVLNSGALPVSLQVEAINKVSATLGKDSLSAAIIAGAIGVGLVLLFMALYYRRLAIVVVGGLIVSGTLIYCVTSLISRFYNGVLSLSGVAGLIVSIGVTIDSYVVFFERLKDEVRTGRSLRNSAQRGFKAAFRTILIADTVSLIGAAVLYYLSVGAVRGFAFYLGLSTIMDIVVAYFFTRPAVLLLARSKFMSGSKTLGLDNEAAIVPATGAPA